MMNGHGQEIRKLLSRWSLLVFDNKISYVTVRRFNKISYLVM